MKKILPLLLVVLPILLVLSCKDYYNLQDPVASTVGDSTNAQLLAELDQFQSGTFELKDVRLPNGQNALDFLQENDPLYLKLLTPRNGRITADAPYPPEMGPIKTKNDFIARLAAQALNLSASSLYKGDGTEAQPDHTGLAYVFGSSTLDSRTTGSGNCASVSLQGVDCSGLIYGMLTNVLGSGVERVNANTLRTKAHWDALFSRVGERYPIFKKFKVDVLENAKRPKVSELRSGDVIYWYDVTYFEDEKKTKPIDCSSTACNVKKRTAFQKGWVTVSASAGHVGMIFEANQKKFLVQSNGRQSPATCADNYWDGTEKDKRRGVQALDITVADNVAWFGPQYGVVRFSTKLAGKWEYNDRCQGRTEEQYVVKIALTIDEKEESDGKQAVTGSGTGVDYNDTPITIKIEGTYDSPAQKLECIVTTSFQNGNSRRDKLVTTLLDDTTNWLSTTGLQSGGCVIEVKLVNLEKNR